LTWRGPLAICASGIVALPSSDTCASLASGCEKLRLPDGLLASRTRVSTSALATSVRSSSGAPAVYTNANRSLNLRPAVDDFDGGATLAVVCSMLCPQRNRHATRRCRHRRSAAGTTKVILSIVTPKLSGSNSGRGSLSGSRSTPCPPPSSRRSLDAAAPMSPSIATKEK
jgi:hypothetical protein